MKIWGTKGGNRIIRIISGRCNVFFLTNGKLNILVDTSVSRTWNRIQKRIYQAGIDHLDYLVLTHAHFDHAGNARKIREKYLAKVIVHRDEAASLESGDTILPKGTTLVTGFIVKTIGKRLRSRLKYEPCRYDLAVGESFDMKDLGINGYIMHTPGHTRGSVSIIVDNEIAVVGDTMFGVFPGSAFPPYAEDAGEILLSWKKLLETGCSIFLPSHGSARSRAQVQKDFDKRLKIEVEK